MKPEPDRIIVRCPTCNVEWDMDAEPARCVDDTHGWSLNGGPLVDADGRPA